MEGSRASPPTNYYSPAAGEGSIRPNRRRSIGEILASEGYGYSYDSHSYDNAYSNDYLYGDSYYDTPYDGYVCSELTAHHDFDPNAEMYEELKQCVESCMEQTTQLIEGLRADWEEMTAEIISRQEKLASEVQALQERLDQQERKKIESMVKEILESTKRKMEEEPALPAPPEVCSNSENRDQISIKLKEEIANFREVPHIDFIFSPTAFNPPVHSATKLYFLMMFPYAAVSFIAKHMALLPWALVFFLAHVIHCVNRRRTKGPLAQPFDSCD